MLLSPRADHLSRLFFAAEYASFFSSSCDAVAILREKCQANLHPLVRELAGSYRLMRNFHLLPAHHFLIDYIESRDMALACIDRKFDSDFHSVAYSVEQKGLELVQLQKVVVVVAAVETAIDIDHCYLKMNNFHYRHVSSCNSKDKSERLGKDKG
jgi:hypothetical protein